MADGSAAAVESMVARLRAEMMKLAKDLDLERARSRRLWTEGTALRERIQRLERERDELINQIGAGHCPIGDR